VLINRLLNRIAFFCPGGSTLRPALQRRRGVRIGRQVWISQYVYFDELHPEAIIIGDNVTIGLRTSLITHLYWGTRRQRGGCRKIIIDNDVFIGPHCLLLPGVRIGRGTVIKGGTTLTRSVPPGMLCGYGDPEPLAKATVPLTREHSYTEFVAGLKPVKPGLSSGTLSDRLVTAKKNPNPMA
jgi:serine acetyltransferase